MSKWLNGTVVENRRWTEEVTSLKIDAPLGQRAGKTRVYALTVMLNNMLREVL